LVFVVIVKLSLPGISPTPSSFLNVILDGCDNAYKIKR